MATANKTNLTDALVAGLKAPATGQSFHWDTKQQGLGVRITASGVKSYIAQAQCNGKTVRVTLARVGEVDVKEARRRASAATLLMRDGTNPLALKRADSASKITLRQVMEQYIANRRTKFGPLRDSSKREIRKHCTKLEKWLDRPIAAITHTMVAARFRELSASAPVSANLVMVTLQSLCSWARDSSIGPDGVPTLLPFNPVTTAFKQLVKWNHVTPRTKRVPTNKTGPVWSLLHGRMDSNKHPPSVNQGAALVLGLMLTGCRINELATLRWEQVVFTDPNGSYITFDTKTHRVLKVPLTRQLEALLRQQWERREPRLPWVFLGKTRKTHIKDTRATMEFVSEASGLHLSPHTLRRSFVMAGHTVGLQQHEIELLSGHVPQTVTLKHYMSTDDLRWLLPKAQQLSNWLEGQGAIYDAQQRGENIVQLQTA